MRAAGAGMMRHEAFAMARGKLARAATLVGVVCVLSPMAQAQGRQDQSTGVMTATVDYLADKWLSGQFRGPVHIDERVFVASVDRLPPTVSEGFSGVHSAPLLRAIVAGGRHPVTMLPAAKAGQCHLSSAPGCANDSGWNGTISLGVPTINGDSASLSAFVRLTPPPGVAPNGRATRPGRPNNSGGIYTVVLRLVDGRWAVERLIPRLTLG
jgi:hypothetical protein